jgi:uncharacterized protein (DUF1778 family)
MAKKQSSKSSLGNESKETRTRIVKVFLSDAEMKTLRVAAALTDAGVSEFVRAAALEKAANVVRDGFRPKA